MSKVSDAARRLFSGSNIGDLENIDINGTLIPVKFKYLKGQRNLLICFHGAVDRATREVPAFVPFVSELGDTVAQLIVSDPSMLRDGEFSMAWYSGDENFFAQKILAEFFSELIRVGEFTRVVLFGSSGGGFASLLYSSYLSNSIAVPCVPQTNINKYYSGHVSRYRAACWPSLASNEQLAEVICTDLCELYSQVQDNTVIYLQSAGDIFHTRNHFAPFLRRISSVDGSRFIANSGFWGKLSHSRAVPAECYVPWLKAAFLSPSTEVDDLLVTHHELTTSRSLSPVGTERAGKGSGSGAEIDIRLANLLRDYHLRQASER